MQKKILVTGSKGLLGSAIRRVSANSQDEFVFVSRSDADLRDPEATLQLFKLHAPTHIVHLAAVVGGVGSNTSHPGMYFYENSLINSNVLESARRVGVQKLVSFLSTCVFPDKVNYPLKEDLLHFGPPHASNYGYAYAKRMLEVQSRAYRQEFGCKFITLIPTNIYGPDDNFSLTDGHVLPALMHRAFLAKKENQDLVVWGSGQPLREFVYSDDIAKLTLWALEHYDEPMPLLISSDLEVSIQGAVGQIVDQLNFPGKVVFDSSKPDGQFRKPSDSSRLRKYVTDFQFTPLSEGLKKTIQWFNANYPEIRK